MSAARILFLLSVLSAFVGCTRCSPTPATTDAGTHRPAGATIRLAFITDLKGYLEPCGCTTRPLGGVDRLAGTLDRLQRDGVPMAVVAAGDLFLSGSDTASADQQERWQAETVAGIFDDIGVVAAVPGRRDRVRGDALLASLRAHSRFAWLGAASLAPAEVRLAAAHEMRLGDTKVAFVGVTDAFGATQESLVAAARAEVARVRAGGARLVVVLLRGDRRLGRAIGMIDGVDFVIQGGIDSEHPEPPTPRGAAFVLEGGYQGQRLVVVDLFLRAPPSASASASGSPSQSPMRDESRWTRTTERERQLRQNAERRTQIAAWEQRGDVAAADLAAQRSELARGEQAVRALDRAPDVARGNAFVAEVIELAAGAPVRASVASRQEALAIRVNDHNRTALADLAPEPVPEGAATYVGSEACRSCHEGANRWWEQHPHGNAYATLVRRHREFNLQCVGCHVTGYGRPGGATVTQNLGGALINVGCESCHGPGSLHVASPEAAGAISLEVPASTCTGCHNHEHSDAFAYDVYRQRILVPGHGRPTGATPP